MIPSPLSPNPGIGILHLGLGAFHRAHQAAFTEDAVAAAGGDWGIEAVAMRNPALATALTARGGRYTLIERHPQGPVLREIGIIRRAVALPGQTEAVAARLADPAIRVATLTVTEKGYGADPSTRALDRADPAVAQDLAQPEGPPRSLAGLLVRGLAQRRAAGAGGLTLISCDNLAGNGRLLEGLVAEMAARSDPGLGRWIAASCRFPDSMVDRITPAASPATLALAEAALGHPDPAAIETEPFRQWVIAGDFAGPRPAWEAAGVLFVPEVAPFEQLKLRMLNGTHSLIAALGALAGLAAVRDAMARPALRALARLHMDRMAMTLPALPGLDPGGYAAALVSRLANPAIDHRLLQIAQDGSQKLPQRLLAPAAEALARGLPVDTVALAVAAWIRFLGGRDDAGAPLPLVDPLAERLRAALLRAGPGPEARVAALAALPGLAHHGALDHPGFAAAVAAQLQTLDTRGAEAAAAALMGAQPA